MVKSKICRDLGTVKYLEYNFFLKKISVQADSLQSANGCTGFSGELGVGWEVNLIKWN